jgi:hypothetical protein
LLCHFGRQAEPLGQFAEPYSPLLRGNDSDKNKRRSTLTQLNRGEGRHSLGRAVFHGKRGELRQRYREGQEDQLGALGLVVNMIVLWNTIYMEAALNQLRLEGYQVWGGGCRQTFSAYPRPHQHAGPVFIRDAGNGSAGRTAAIAQSGC